MRRASSSSRMRPPLGAAAMTSGSLAAAPNAILAVFISGLRGSATRTMGRENIRVDSAYRGELRVILLNTDPHEPFVVKRGDRLAQLVIQRVEEVHWTEIDSLDGNDRGGGFGHTGRE